LIINCFLRFLDTDLSKISSTDNLKIVEQVQTRITATKFLSFFILLSFLFLDPSVLRASHIVGGEMTYKFISRNPATQMITYRITLHVYRDRFSTSGTGGTQTQLDANATIATYQQLPNNSYKLVGTNQRPLLSKVNLPTPVIPCSETPTNVGAEDGLYEWDQVLRDTNGSYFISYQRCCRNATISNIPTPASYGGTYYVEITPEAQHQSNSSPVFKNFPPVFICEGEPLTFDHSAKDTNGDQLVYRFCNAYAGGSSSSTTATNPPPYALIPYKVPYSAATPMKGNPTIKIDANTGVMTGTPDAITGTAAYQQFVVTICAEEYRGGQLIGRVFRDFQFNVVRCKKLVVSALVSDSTAGKAFFINGCENVSLTINNQSYDRANIPNYYWNFFVRQDTIRYNDWSPAVTFNQVGIYKGQLLLNPGTPCSDTAYVTVNVGGRIYPNFTTKYDSCVAGDVEFASVTTSLIPLKKMLWEFGDNTTDSNKLNTAHLYATPGLKSVKLSVKDNYGCVGDTSIQFNWQPAPPILIVEPDNFTGCAPAKVRFYNRSTPIDSTYKILWDFGDGMTGNSISPTHIYAKPDTYTVKLMITSPIGCYKESEFRSWIKVKSLPKADFDWTPKVINNLKPQVSFLDKSTPDVIGWRWFFSDKAYSPLKNPPFTYRDTGAQQVKLYVVNLNGCRDSIFKTLYIEPEMTFHFPNAFSPNFDTVNDEFKGTGFLYGMKAFKMTIWNRWGEKIFETIDPTEGWNGSKHNSGRQEPEGVYLYEIEYTTPKNEVKNKKDFLTLFR
jgi:gliding motility-associated-like protein